MFTCSMWSLSLHYSEKLVRHFTTWTVNILTACEWPTMLACTQTTKLHSSLTPVSITESEKPTVHIFGTETYLALSQGKVPVPGLHTEKCSLLYVMLPASSSVVNTACVVYGNVGHLFVVLLGVRPQVKVDDCGVDAAGLCVSLLQ